MSKTVNYQVVRSKDEAYLNALVQLTSTDSAGPMSTIEIQLYGGTNENCSTTDVGSNEKIQTLIGFGGQVFQSTKLRSSDGHIYVQIRRPNQDNSSADPIFDSVTISGGHDKTNMLDGIQFAKLLAQMQQILPPVSSSNLGPILGPGVDKHFAAREEALNRLEHFADKIFRDFETTRQAREADALKREKELEERFQKKHDQLEADFKIKTEQLDAERATLEILKSEIDDRSSTHARRDIRKELKQILAKTDRLKNTPETGRRRLIIGFVYVIFLGLFGTVAGVLLFRELNAGTGLDYWQIARQAIFSIAFAVSAGFFLRWLNSWAQQMADEELRQKQFELDLERASWLVEMALEWKSEKGVEIPEHLLSKLSNNLFGRTDSDDQSMTASDALASAILGTAAKAKVSVPGAEIEIDRNGLKKLGKTISKRDA